MSYVDGYHIRCVNFALGKRCLRKWVWVECPLSQYFSDSGRKSHFLHGYIIFVFFVSLLHPDIREGNLKAVLGLFFALSRFKQLQQQEEKAQQQLQQQKQQPKKTAQKSQQQRIIQQQPKTQLQTNRQKSPQPPQRTQQQRAQQRQNRSSSRESAHQYSPYQSHSPVSSTGVSRAAPTQV